MNPSPPLCSPPFPSLARVEGSVLSLIGQHMADAFDQCVRDPRTVREDGCLRLITGEPHPFGNFALLSREGGAAWVDRAVQPLCSGPLPSAVILTVPATAAVEALLAERGFCRGQIPAMAIDIATLPPAEVGEGLEWVRVVEADQAEEWVQTLAPGYELPLAVARAFGPDPGALDRSPRAVIQHFMIRRSGRAVATSVLFLSGGLAGIYCVSTVPTERRKGLGGYATAEALRQAGRLGYGVGILQSSEAGYPVYRRLGFREFGGLGLYLRLPS
jgi:hypothetical protein